ncbi:hypothetical protein SGFS_050700 [Streptomyces graminofaciens]|uniref:HTH cro/C1-type domain-containing protein n=1 Tax=Streptomyces graminofaciens TaxID=68212 RepID=A0ABN5VKA8_9ACTN|nr:hypothetical protein SGFS_050700 [Streptomyces graminofaciens]
MEESLGRAVRTRRTEIGMTQTRLAELSGMTQAAISRLEHGKCMPTFPLLERIASAFGSPLLVSIEPGRGVTASFGGMGESEERTMGGMGGPGERGMRGPLQGGVPGPRERGMTVPQQGRMVSRPLYGWNPTR